MSKNWSRLFWAGFLVVGLFGSVTARADDAGGCVALTFDDGPDATLTPKLLDILAAEHVKATFFVVGRRVAQWPEIVQRAYREGHEIGNHTWDHLPLTQLSSAQVQSEISRTDAAIQAATGATPAVIRAPYGAQSYRIAELAAPRPLIFWDTDTLDWLHRNSDRVARVADHTPAGTIVLMHDIHPTTIEAVPTLIEQLKARGIGFVTVSDFLRGQCGRGASIAFHQVQPSVAAPATRVRATAVGGAAGAPAGTGKPGKANLGPEAPAPVSGFVSYVPSND